MSSEKDPFCETRFWYGTQDKPNHIQNPLSMATGIVMCVAPLLIKNTDSKVPVFLAIAKASLSITGAGTSYYHAVSPSQASNEHYINHQMFDWVPICVMAAQVMILYVTNLVKFKSERIACLVLFVIFAWCTFLILGMDSHTELFWRNHLDTASEQQSTYGSFMNAILLVPMLLTITYCTVFIFAWEDASFLWYSLFLSLNLWLLNAYTCDDYPWTSVFHAIYHLVISYSFLHAICLGVSIDWENWHFYKKKSFWPMVAYKRCSRVQLVAVT